MKKTLLIITFFLASNAISFCQEESSDTAVIKTRTPYQFSGQENVGKKIIPFKAFDLFGNKYSDALLTNKITFINFWYEACRPCIAEAEAMNNLYETFSKRANFQFLTFTFDKKENAERFVKKHNIKYPVLLVSIDSANILNFRQGFPVSIIVNKVGRIEVFSPGGPDDPIWAQKKFNTLFKPALNFLLKQCK